VLRAAISFGILAALVWWLPTDRLLAAIDRVPGEVWAIVVAGFVAGHVCAAFKWRVLLRATGVDVSFAEALRAHAAGLFANLCLPSLVGGDFVRAALVAHSKRGIERVALAGIADRMNDTLALLVIAGAALWLVPSHLDTRVLEVMAWMSLLLPVGVAVGVVVLLRVRVEAWPERLAGVVERMREALQGLVGSPGSALGAGGLSVCIQAAFVGLNVLFARAMGIEVAVAVWFLVWPLAKLMALAPVSLGGLGVREVALAALLAPFGVASSMAVAQSLCWEVVLVASGLAAGAFALASGARIPLRRSGPEGGAPA
jgi:uncharacterized membrane protein YbhN (UPF0104 family)